MKDWKNGEAIWWQTEKIETEKKRKEAYGEYFIIGSVIIAGVIVSYYFSKYLCPVSAREGRYFDVNLFLTPNEPAVQSVATKLKSGAISNCFYAVAPITETECKVHETLGYVHANITYTSDKKKHGLSEYWSFPKETLESGEGDCEDISFTIASILLALNLPSDRVRVALGVKDFIGHAWCEVLLNDKWFILEGARGTITPIEEAKGYSADCYVYQNKCKTLNAARYGLHNMLEPLEALSSVHNDSKIATDATKVNGDGYITTMYDLIAETARDTRERTFSFCHKDGITTTPTNIGTEQEVYLVECEEGEKVGDFHTHLDTTKFSVADTINLVRQNHFSCVGAVAENKISCLEVNRADAGFEEWEQRLYESAVEPLELREWLVHSPDLTPRQWLDLYDEYETALTAFEAIITEGMYKGYLVDSTVELLRELSLA